MRPDDKIKYIRKDIGIIIPDGVGNGDSVFITHNKFERNLLSEENIAV
ncbi:MAG: hypothetical protein V1775_08420 [Bacteroidota bacterium]